MRVGDGNRYQGRADHAKRVALDELPRSPVALEIRADEPEREHVEEEVAEAGVEQRVGDQLPYFAFHHETGISANHSSTQRRSTPKPAQDELEQENSRARQDDAPDPSGEGREAERNGAAASHERVVFYLSGSGTTGRLRWPAASSARTPNITLSFETFRVARVPLVTVWTCSQSGALVARQTTS